MNYAGYVNQLARVINDVHNPEISGANSPEVFVTA